MHHMKKPYRYLILLLFVPLSFLFGCHAGLRTNVDTPPIKQAKPRDPTIKLELFVMSKCPYGVEAVKAIIPILEEFQYLVDFKLYFIAQTADQFPERSLEDKETKEKAIEDKAKEKGYDSPENPPEYEGRCHGEPVYEGGKFVSLHGKSEVEEDIRQVVIMKYYPEKFWDYLLYRSENYETDNWEEAAARAWIDIDHVRQVSEDGEGERLFSDNIKRAQGLKITASPTLIINNQRYNGQINYNRLARLICSKNSRLRQCRNVPVCGHDNDCKASGKAGLCQNPDTPQARCRFADPVNISLSVIDMPHAIEEEINRIIEFSRYLFPSIDIKRLRWDSKEAQKLIQKYNIGILPAFLFSKEVDQALRFIRLKNDLIFEEDAYILKDQIFSTLYFPDREEKDGQLEIFIESLNTLDNHLIQQIQRDPRLKGYPLSIHFLAKMENKNQSSPILSMHTDPNQPNMLILSPQEPRITFRSRKGLPEIQEDIRQLCIAKEYSKKYLDYMACRSNQIVNQDGDSEKMDDWKLCAQNAGLPIHIIEECSNSEKGAGLLIEDIRLAEELEIQSTPSFFINNKWFVKGNKLKTIIELISKTDKAYNGWTDNSNKFSNK